MSSLSKSSMNFKYSFYADPLKKLNGTRTLGGVLIPQSTSKEQNHEPSAPATTRVHDYCTICEKTLAESENLMEHTISHFDFASACCAICGKVYKNYEKFRKHAKKHPRLPITCDTSDEEIEEPTTKPKQKQTKSLEDDADLFEISERLPWSDTSESSDSDDDSPIPRIEWPWMAQDFEIAGAYHPGKLCRFCMAYVPYNQYSPHNKDHLKGTFLCEICGLYYLTYKTYQRHNYKHDERLLCPHCGRSSKSPSSLKSHIAMQHTGEASHPCSYCGKKFFNFRHLKNHEKRHKNILNYECEVCNKRFFNSHGRRSHMRQHTDEKPFKCQCGEAFRHNVSLKAHQKSKHGINEDCTVPCNQCDRKFASVTALLTHLRKHPSDNKPKAKRKRKPKANGAGKDNRAGKDDEAGNSDTQSKGRKRKGGGANEDETTVKSSALSKGRKRKESDAAGENETYKNGVQSKWKKRKSVHNNGERSEEGHSNGKLSEGQDKG